jgi:hypothetical protein
MSRVRKIEDMKPKRTFFEVDFVQVGKDGDEYLKTEQLFYPDPDHALDIEKILVRSQKIVGFRRIEEFDHEDDGREWNGALRG